MTVPCPHCGDRITPKQDQFYSGFGDIAHLRCRKRWEQERAVRGQIRDAMAAHKWTAEKAQKELGLSLPVKTKKRR